MLFDARTHFQPPVLGDNFHLGVGRSTFLRNVLPCLPNSTAHIPLVWTLWVYFSDPEDTLLLPTTTKPLPRHQYFQRLLPEGKSSGLIHIHVVNAPVPNGHAIKTWGFSYINSMVTYIFIWFNTWRWRRKIISKRWILPTSLPGITIAQSKATNFSDDRNQDDHLWTCYTHTGTSSIPPSHEMRRRVGQ